MKVIVCGGRQFDDFRKISLVLDTQHEETPFSVLIHGDALGADRTAAKWARARRVPTQAFPANWERDGIKAGPIRNSQMLAQRPDLVIAFPGGKGTADMVRKAKAAGVAVTEIGESFPS